MVLTKADPNSLRTVEMRRMQEHLGQLPRLRATLHTMTARSATPALPATRSALPETPRPRILSRRSQHFGTPACGNVTRGQET